MPLIVGDDAAQQEGEDQSGTGSEDASAGASAGGGSTSTSASPAEVDKSCPKAGDDGVSVCDGHDVKLNQTNISQNNNKFYILQVMLRARFAVLAGCDLLSCLKSTILVP